jgi:hypothetical protein
VHCQKFTEAMHSVHLIALLLASLSLGLQGSTTQVVCIENPFDFPVCMFILPKMERIPVLIPVMNT